MTEPAREVIILAPNEGRDYPMGRIRATFKADGAETLGRYSISEWWLEPRTQGPGAHAHEEDDLFYVVEGTMSILVGDRWIDAPKGSFVLAPGGVTHDFENRSGARAGVLNVSAPGNFEPNMPAIAAWFAEHPPGAPPADPCLPAETSRAGRAIVLGPEGGRDYPMGRIRATFKADGAETLGRYSISEWWLAPRTKGPGAHAHDEDGVFYVIEGVMSLLVGERWIDAPEGSFVLAPGGVTHDFENRSSARAGIFAVSVPGGLEDEMPGIAAWFAEHPPGDTEPSR